MRPDDAVTLLINRALCCGPACHRGTDASGPCLAANYGAAIRQRLEAAGYIILSAADHDRRITDLLEANNREVQRRREADSRRRAAEGAVSRLIG
jgi:hypothetical protein